MGFSNYFLIVWDIVRFAKRLRFPSGQRAVLPAVWWLTVWALLRSINSPQSAFRKVPEQAAPESSRYRSGYCYQRREEVINYIIKRFGKKHVARIGTYGTYGHKSAENEIIRICGKSKPELVQQLIGLKQYFSTHAAGVIITPKPVTSYSGVEEVDGTWVTQLAMDDLAFLGVLKIDFLSLRTLTILKDIELLVQETDPGFKLEDVPFSDRVTFDLLQQGLTLGIFQVESQLFQELLPQIKPNSFADLVATLALVRPGPLKQIPLYIRRKEGLAQVNYLHPKLATILGETYGLMVYQEQVMQVAHEIAGLSLEEADLLRLPSAGKTIVPCNSCGRNLLPAASKQASIPKRAASCICKSTDLPTMLLTKPTARPMPS